MKTKVTREGKKLEAPVTLFAAIEAEDHEFLRSLAFRERHSLADIVREAIHDYRTKKQCGGGTTWPLRRPWSSTGPSGACTFRARIRSGGA